MKRIKRVFSSNDQLCHVWAQMKQDEGQGNNMFFVNTTEMYSYGFHYLAAKIHTVNGQNVALIRSDTYSNSTSEHLYKAERAVRGLMSYYRVPNVKTLNSVENINYFNESVIEQCELIFNRTKVRHKADKQYDLENLYERLKEANEFFELIGHKTLTIPSDFLDLLEEHLDYRIQRYAELNTPEMIKKREEEQQKRALKKYQATLKKLETDIQSWRNFERYSLPRNTLEFDILRVKNGEVQTSSGATVPLSHALRLLTLIERGQAREGERIGHFTLDKIFDAEDVFPSEGTKIIKIGCHKIKLSEAQNVLGPFRDQELKAVQ